MADLSAVLRKTIDGLPQATPQLRAKVYEKARGAIARQIEAADPPLSDEIAGARHAALEDAIERTESYYSAVQSLEDEAGFDEPAPVSVTRPPSAPSMPSAALPMDGVALGRPAWQTSKAPPVNPHQGRPQDLPAPARRPIQRDAASLDPRVSSLAAPPVASAGAARGDRRGSGLPDGAVPVRLRDPRPLSETEPSSGFDTSDIPAADLRSPRIASAERRGGRTRSRTPVFVSLAALVLLGGGGATAYVYRDDIQALLNDAEGKTTTASASGPSTTTPAASNAGSAPVATSTATATSTASAPKDETSPIAPSSEPDATEDAEVEPPAPDNTQNTDTDVAALDPSASAPVTAVTPPAAPAPPPSGRRFTQRLLPDGTEVDPGHGPGDANAFEEGTDVAAASPGAPAPVADTGTAAPVVASAERSPAGSLPQQTTAGAGTTAPAASGAPAAGPASPTVTAALPPDQVARVPVVSQKAVFYEERSETEQLTQQGGNVVWSVINEPPAEGQPAEPAIQAVVDVPDQKIKMTMTIRRNGDATLPASHVIELMFDVPPGFSGGQIATVQRLALKPNEQARGEPLIGVAGKMSDGFFVIALNNLNQATQTNLDLLGKEEWIDIPLVYATGRRALMSIEKGIPGDRVFKQAMDAWAAKT